MGLHGGQQRGHGRRQPLQLGRDARHGIALARAHAMHKIVSGLGRIELDAGHASLIGCRRTHGNRALAQKG